MELSVTLSEPYVKRAGKKKFKLDCGKQNKVYTREALKKIAFYYPGLKKCLPLSGEESEDQFGEKAVVIVNNKVIHSVDNPPLQQDDEIFLLYPLSGG